MAIHNPPFAAPFPFDCAPMNETMKDKLLQLTKREYDPRKRLVGLAIEGTFFVGIVPLVLIYLSPLLDARLRLPPLPPEWLCRPVGLFLMVSGLSFAGWAVYVQFTIGRGTPVPIMATQELIVQRPYNYCRNPMALGTIALYLGVALSIGSISAIGLVLIGASVLLTYIKIAEEREMELRFGDAYREYREHTPFLIPRLRDAAHREQ